MAEKFSIDGESLTRTPDIRFVWGKTVEGVSEKVSLRKITGKNEFCIYAKPLGQKGELAVSEHIMQFLTPTNQSEYIGISQGHELDQDLPWVFEKSINNEKVFAFCRQGSGAIKSSRAILCVPSDSKLYGEGSAFSFESKGKLGDRDLWEISGTIKIEAIDSFTYKVRCGQATATNDEFELYGKRLWDIFLVPGKAFRGIPHLYQVSENGFKTLVQGQIIPIIPKGISKTCIENINDIIGPVTVYWPNKNEIKWQSRIVLLPADAKDTVITPNEDVISGALYFPNWGLASIETEAPNIRIKHTINDNNFSVSVNYTGKENPPEWISCFASWLGNSTKAKVIIPFPAKGIRAIDNYGSYLRDKTKLSLNQISGIRIFGFLGDSNTADLIFELFGTDRNIRKHDIFQKIRFKPNKKRIEVCLASYLSNIQYMLASTDALDAYVKFTLTIGSHASFSLYIARYACEFVLTNSQVELPQEVLSTLSIDEIKELPVFGIRINAPNEEPVSLEPLLSNGAPLGAWKLPKILTNDQWFIYPGINSIVDFRPISLPNTGSHHFISQQSYRLAGALSLALEDERNVALDNIIKNLALDFMDQDWQLIAQLEKQVGHLSLSTFDLWRRFIYSPIGMAALVVKMNLSSFTERFADELPFSWETIPLSAWVQAMGSAINQANNFYGLDENHTIVNMNFDSLIKKLSSISSLLEVVCTISTGLMSDDMKLAKVPDCNKIFEDQLFNSSDSRLQQLLRSNKDKEWPDIGILNNKISMAKNTEANIFFYQQNLNDFRCPVIDLPIYLALCASEKFTFTLEYSNKATIESIRKIRLFDPDWFSEAFNLTIARCISTGKIEIPD